MFTFIRDSFGELEHVVWPTPKETRKYMNYTVAVIVIMTIILSVVGYFFRESLLFARHTINPNSTVIQATGEDTPATQQDMDELLRQFGVTGATQQAVSGNILSGASVEVTPVTSDELTPAIPETLSGTIQ